MLRALSFFVLLFVCGTSLAEEKIIQRGEYRFSIAPTPAFVEIQPLAEQWPAGAPGAKDSRWRNWLFDSQSDYRKGDALSFLDQAYEALSPELVANAAKQQIYFNPEYQTLSIHKVELRRAGDPAAIVAASSKVRDALGWTPQHDNLDEIVLQALNWERGVDRLKASAT